MSEPIPDDVKEAAKEIRRRVHLHSSPSSCDQIIAEALLAAEKRGEQRERDRADDLEEILHRIRQWCGAYPIDIFPEPDFKRVRELLAVGGITLDAVSASNMRYVVTQIAKMIPASAPPPEQGLE